jgi:hypothetical protein
VIRLAECGGTSEPHLALEVVYLQAQRWLADADAFSGLTDIPLRRNGQEITNVPQLHEYYDRPTAEVISLARLFR